MLYLKLLSFQNQNLCLFEYLLGPPHIMLNRLKYESFSFKQVFKKLNVLLRPGEIVEMQMIFTVLMKLAKRKS